jgi:hypothetical protein
MSFAVLLLSATSLAPQISVGTLLPEMTDLMHLTHRPKPFYLAAQASSYDRASNPGLKSDPFANGDAGQFVRNEEVDGRVEHVMADLKGPGSVMRFWSANPAGVVRFYFDGESTPRITEKLADLLTGKVAPLVKPFAYEASMGTDLYFPLPYAKSLKVTIDNSDGDKARSLYYQIGYRTYERGTQVKTFEWADLKANSAQMIRQRTVLEHPELAVPKGLTERTQKQVRLAPGKGFTTIFADERSVVRELTIKIPFPIVLTIRAMDWSDPHQPHNVLRAMTLGINVDGKKVVEAPLGDFFATAPGLNPVKTLPFEVFTDGTMICRLPIPYERRLAIQLVNRGTVDVPVSLSTKHDKFSGGKFYTLHSQFLVDKGSTRPMRDMNFLTARGEGLWLGSNMHVANPTPAWWGEGDEKVYVDEETFPSTFGTGTEDYYGYAWCCPVPFERPYHAQPRADGPGNFGHTDVARFHVLDPIPFRRAFRFDMEMWHWQEVEATYAHTAYWYAPPSNVTAQLPLVSEILPPELKPPAPVKGAIEGESMPIKAKTGGTTENQGGFWELSGGEQLWWKDPKPGDKLELTFEVPASGRYEVIGSFCFARDYGIHRLRIDGIEGKEYDFYGTGVNWKKVSLGTFDLSPGKHSLEAVCVGNNPAALPARMFGLDYLLLEKR